MLSIDCDAEQIVFFNLLDVHWSSPASGDLWCKSEVSKD